MDITMKKVSSNTNIRDGVVVNIVRSKPPEPGDLKHCIDPRQNQQQPNCWGDLVGRWRLLLVSFDFTHGRDLEYRHIRNALAQAVRERTNVNRCFTARNGCSRNR